LHGGVGVGLAPTEQEGARLLPRSTWDS
jgi:hypothetical protein